MSTEVQRIPGRVGRMKSFGKSLRAARLAAGLTQVEAAERAKISQPGWVDYEQGRKMPKLDTADRLAKAVKATLRELL